MSKRKRKKAGSVPQPPNKTYAESPQRLLEILGPQAEWPEPERGVLAQRTRKQANPSGERAAAAHDILQGLAPHLSPTEPVELFLDETRGDTSRPIDREGQTKAIVRRSGRTRLRLAGRLSSGQAFTLSVSHQHKARLGGGHYQPADSDGELPPRWVPGKPSEAWKTRVDLLVGLNAEDAKALDRDELRWLMKLPTWVKTPKLKIESESLSFGGTCNGIPMPGEFAEWIVAPIAALTTRRRTPDDPEAPDPEVRGLFQNLVLAALVDGHLDPSESSFLSERAGWLGLSAEAGQRLTEEITSGQVTEFYRPEDPVAGRVLFRQTVKTLYADGELGEREERLIRFLARGLDVNQADLAQALGAVAPGPGWAFVAEAGVKPEPETGAEEPQ